MRKPATPADLGFTTRDLQRLSQALADAQQSRAFRRLQAVLLIARGYSATAAAQITGLSLRSVYHLVKRYPSRPPHRYAARFPACRASNRGHKDHAGSDLGRTPTFTAAPRLPHQCLDG